MEDTINKLKALAENIQAAKLGERGREAHVNSYIVIDEYHEWRTETEYFLSGFFDQSNSLFKRFMSLPDEGNGHVLMHSFNLQYPIFKTLLKKVESGDLNDKKIIEPSMAKNNIEKTVFISHSTKDKAIVDAFIDLILHGALSVPIDQIFCTSTDGTKIKSGEDWRNHIKDNLLSAKINFLIITPNYKESEVCLNEMGAGWVTSAKVLPLIVAPINFKTVGIIQEPNQIEKLVDSKCLDRIKDEVQALLSIPSSLIKSDRWTEKKQQFIESVNSYIASTPFPLPLDRDIFTKLHSDLVDLQEKLEYLEGREQELLNLIEALKDAKDKTETVSIFTKLKFLTPDKEFQDLCDEVKHELSENESIINGIIYKTYVGKGVDIDVDRNRAAIDDAFADDYITEDLDANWSSTKKMRAIKVSLDNLSKFLQRDLAMDFYNTYEKNFESPLDIGNKSFWEECFDISIRFK